MSLVKTFERKTKVYQVVLSGVYHDFEESEAWKLYEQLGQALGDKRLKQEVLKCNDRFSHSAHSEVKNGIVYVCTGRSFDAT